MYSSSFSLDGSCEMTQETLKLLMGEDVEPITYKIKAKSSYALKTQRRKHKAKRINKKWAKRYGYEITYVPYEITFDKCILKEDGSFEVMANNL